MAKLRVGTGWGKLEWAAALNRAAAGDQIIFDPGTYEVGKVDLRYVTLEARSPGEVTLVGNLQVHADVALINLRIQASPYTNTIVVHENAHARLFSCQVSGCPSEKYFTLWHKGTLTLDHSVLRDAGDAKALLTEKGTTLYARNSALGRIELKGSQGELTNCSAGQLIAADGSRLNTFDDLVWDRVPGQRLFAVSGQSACHFQRFVLPDAYTEGFVDDSLVRIGSVRHPGDEPFNVLTTNGAKVLTDDPGITLQDQDAQPEPEPEPPAPPAPKFVHWPAAAAREFATAVAPQLRVGDTLILDEGDYFLEDHDNVLRLGVNIVGQGRPEHTTIHGMLLRGELDQPTVRNVTIQAPPAYNAVNIVAGAPATITFDNVHFAPEPTFEYPTVWVADATLQLRDCTIHAEPGNSDAGILRIEKGGQLEAHSSMLGWLKVSQGGAAALTDCTTLGAYAEADARISADGLLTLLDNTGNYYPAMVGPGAHVSLGEVKGGVEEVAVKVHDGAFSLASFDGNGISIHETGTAQLDLADVIYDRYVTNDQDGLDFVETVNAPLQKTSDAHTPQTAGGERADEPGQPAAPSEQEPATAPVDDDGDPMAELNRLIGLGKVKQQVQSFINQVRFNQKRAELGLKSETAFTLHSLFLGNPGTGKTTVARLIGKALHKAGVIATDRFVEVGRADLVSSNIGGTAPQTLKVLESALGGVLFIDEAYALAQEGNTDFSQEAVDTILAFMENHRTDLMVIFAGYRDKMQDFLRMNEGLTSRVPNRFDFEDYTGQEIADIGLHALHGDDYHVNEELYRRVVASSYQRSNDRSNGRWVRNFNQALLEQLIGRVSAIDDPTVEDLMTVADADLHALSGGDPTSQSGRVEELLAELDSLIGLAPVKTWVRGLINQAKVNRRMIEVDGDTVRPSYHMAFTGNPGTGKTTVARIVAELFHALGILSTSTVLETDRSRLLGSYIGHTERNTSRIVDEALGGVLFVDEAYQLYVEGSDNDFGRQAIETLLPRLENDRDKFVAIFAGYSHDMDRFFAANQGLRSRVPHTIEFPDYTSEEVAGIVALTLGARWRFNEELLREVAATAYDALPAADRSNGRWARNFAEAITAAHTNYLVEHDISGEELKTIHDDVLRSFMPA